MPITKSASGQKGADASLEQTIRLASVNRQLAFGGGLIALLLLTFFGAIFWEHKEVYHALSAGSLDTLLAHPGHFMTVSLIAAIGVTLLSFGTLYFCNYAIAESTISSTRFQDTKDLAGSPRKRSKPRTSLAAAAAEYRLAENVKNRALEAAIAREHEFVVELLGAGLAEFSNGTMGFRMTASYGEYQQLEADFNAAQHQLEAAQGFKE